MFIELTQLQNKQGLGKRLININAIIYFSASNENCNVILEREAMVVKESYDEVKEMLALRAHPSWNDRYLNELASARKGLEPRLGES